MKTSQLFTRDQPVFSFEVFPPRDLTAPNATQKVCDTLEVLQRVQPDFVSVTFRNAGLAANDSTIAIAKLIRDKYGIEPVVHLPAAKLSRGDVDGLLNDLQNAGIQNILALRGDIPATGRTSNDFPFASDLVSYIHTRGDFNVIGACYPEGHPESADPLADIQNLKRKVDAGTSELITQLFYDNREFYHFQERCRFAGITVPIEAGIMPLMTAKQAAHMMDGVTIPEKLQALINRFADKPDALRDAGIAYAIDQIVDLLAHGVDGIHLYTMDNPEVAARIIEATRNIVRA